jgi:hypothetical protein
MLLRPYARAKRHPNGIGKKIRFSNLVFTKARRLQKDKLNFKLTKRTLLKRENRLKKLENDWQNDAADHEQLPRTRLLSFESPVYKERAYYMDEFDRLCEDSSASTTASVVH